MTKNTSITLGDHFGAFVDAQVSSGRYASTSEVLRAGLRLLEEQEERLKSLRQALEAGEISGQPRRVTREEFLGSLDALRTNG